MAAVEDPLARPMSASPPAYDSTAVVRRAAFFKQVQLRLKAMPVTPSTIERGR